MYTRRFLVVFADAALATDLAWQLHREDHGAEQYVEAESDRLQAWGYLGTS